MHRLTYILIYLVILPVSLLPFGMIYILSDLFYLILYYLIRYRKGVVRKNLKNAFPEKSELERKRIMKSYYRHICDVIMETMKSYSVRQNDTILKRCSVSNPEIFEKYYNMQKDIIIVSAHYGNWEWAAFTASSSSPHKMQAVYQPLSNPYFDRFMRRNRGKFHLHLIPSDEVAQKFRTQNKDLKTATIFLGDQTPLKVRKHLWMEFLNQETLVNIAIARLSKMMDMPVIYAEIHKYARGKYEIRLKELITDPAKYNAREITYLHARHLESLIREKPEYWLWSHKRWKRKRPDDIKLFNFDPS